MQLLTERAHSHGSRSTDGIEPQNLDELLQSGQRGVLAIWWSRLPEFGTCPQLWMDNRTVTSAELSNYVYQPLILVAEDNFDNRFIAATMLRHSGYRVIEAENGGDAIRLARADHPALILMDIGMPDIDGWTATRTLKDDPATQQIIILAFTAHALPGAADQARDAGCDGYLIKPISPAELVSAVGAALSATSS